MDRKLTLKRKFDFTEEDESTVDVLHENFSLTGDITKRIGRLNSVSLSSDRDIGSAMNDLCFLSEFAKNGMFACNSISSFRFDFFVLIDLWAFLYDLFNFSFAEDIVDLMVVCGVVPTMVKVLYMVSNRGEFDANTYDVEKDCVSILGHLAVKVISL